MGGAAQRSREILVSLTYPQCRVDLILDAGGAPLRVFAPYLVPPKRADVCRAILAQAQLVVTLASWERVIQPATANSPERIRDEWISLVTAWSKRP
jgi:hypothetical protein